MKGSSGFGHTQLAAKDVMEEVEVRDIMVRDRGRTMDLKAPNPIFSITERSIFYFEC